MIWEIWDILRKIWDKIWEIWDIFRKMWEKYGKYENMGQL